MLTRIIRRILRVGIWTLAIAAIVGGLIAGYQRMGIATRASSDVIEYPVQRRTIEDTVVERGTIESQNTVTGKCELPDENNIVEIVAEGTLVKKGDTIAKLESSKIDQKINQKRVAVNEAKGKLAEAKQTLEVKRNEGDGQIVTAKREKELAELDLGKYINGDSKADRSELLRLIADGKAQLEKQREELSNIRYFVKRGFRSADQLAEFEFRVSIFERQVERDEQKLSNFEKYDYNRKEKEFKGKTEDALSKLERVNSTRDAEVSKAESAISNAQQAVELHDSELKELENILAKCTLIAPQDGTVAYANQPYFNSSQRIRTGTRVFHQQDIFFLPDMLNMQVKVSIHESVINRIKKDQTVTIRLDAFPDVKLTGIVSFVAELAASSFTDAKNYESTVVIKEIPEGLSLKPGMTAEVEILVGSYKDILAVPVGAITEHFQQTYVYVRKGTEFKRRAVKTGRMTHSFVEIIEGIEAGESIAMDAYQRGNLDFAAAERKATANQPAAKPGADSAEGQKE